MNRAEFVAREDIGRYNRAFGGVVNHFPGTQVVFAEHDRKALMDPFLKALPFRPAVSLVEVERELNPVGTKAVPARLPGSLPANAMALARDILANPWDFLVVRYARLGIAGRVAQDAKKTLVDAGWVREHAIPRRTGKPPILLEPLPALCAGLQKPMPGYGKGGFLHAFVQQIVMTRLQAQNHTQIKKEAFFGSKAVDVVAIAPNGDLVGFEVSCSLVNLVDNLMKDFQSCPHFAFITAVCLNAADVRQAKGIIAGAAGLGPFHNRIRVEAVADWL